MSVERLISSFCQTYSLAERSALTDGDLIAVLDTESWRDVCGEVLVSLLVTCVLGDEMQVFSADDECAVHLGRDDGAGEDTATDGDKASEWALLVWSMSVMLLALHSVQSMSNSCPMHIHFAATQPISSLSATHVPI